MIRSCLIISPNYPPINKISSLRAYYFALAWREADYAVDVLAAAPADAGGLPREDHDVCARRIAATTRIAWLVKAVWYQLTLWHRGRQYHYILSSYGPASSHALGCLAKCLWPRATWIADYRDLWCSGTYYGSTEPTTFRGFARRTLERMLLRPADWLTTVSRGLKLSLESFHEKPVYVFPNGYEATKRMGARATKTRDTDSSSNHRVRICYTGTINQHRSPMPVVRAMDKTMQANANGYRLEFTIAGVIDDSHLKQLQPYVEKDIVRVAGLVSREESYRIQDAADYCLLLEDAQATRAGVVTGKVFEYFANEKPIIAYGIDAESELAELLRDSGLGAFIGSSEEQLLKFMADLAESGSTALRPNKDLIASYDRMAIARALVDRVTGAAGRT